MVTHDSKSDLPLVRFHIEIYVSQKWLYIIIYGHSARDVSLNHIPANHYLHTSKLDKQCGDGTLPTALVTPQVCLIYSAMV